MAKQWVEADVGQWLLYLDGKEAGAVQTFQGPDGPFYGTWEAQNGLRGGRTGAMSDRLECQRRVEGRVQPQ